jgi:asparagine synthase (glutamine-hydrolysing)
VCGINWFISSRISPEKTQESLVLMNQSIHHRWPDDTGMYFSRNWDYTRALGQVRLSIIDLSPGGHQPMHYRKNLWASNQVFESEKEHDLSIVFNGEIYNYRDIRSELETLGYIFSTHSDTEIILASYDAWGTDCVKKFNGMWAFALLDEKKNTLFCSRDRYGKKPFYYYRSDIDFIFSSEIKGILEHKDLKINTQDNILPEALDFYFTTGNIPAPYTIYKNISKLEAWHHLFINMSADTLSIKKEQYYTLPDYAPMSDKASLIDEWKKLLTDAVKIRMFASDVPVWAFLSGGLDSSSVVAEMTKHVEKSKLHTFSIGFDWKYDETHYIDIVKEAFGTNHHHAYFRESDFQWLLENVSFFYDEPFADYSNFPTMFVSKLAREQVTVSLSWDGGDEVFGWYMMHKIAAQMDMIYRLPLFLRKFFAHIIPTTADNLSLFSRLKEAFRVSTFPREDFYAELGWSSIYRPNVYKNWTREKLRYLLEKSGGNFIQSIIDFDLLYNTLSDNFLVKVDRASMAYALEVRAPFLDYRIVEYARKIPTKWKVSMRKTKILMREIIRDLVPDEIVSRGKQGFEPPIKDWILSWEYISELEEWLESLFEQKILSEDWYKFYKEKVFQNQNSLYNIFRIKLFLLIKWKEKWLPL